MSEAEGLSQRYEPAVAVDPQLGLMRAQEVVRAPFTRRA